MKSYTSVCLLLLLTVSMVLDFQSEKRKKIELRDDKMKEKGFQIICNDRMFFFYNIKQFFSTSVLRELVNFQLTS